jgi:hypothetical protein
MIFTKTQTWHNSIYVNKFVEVKHRNKSLDYQPMMKLLTNARLLTFDDDESQGAPGTSCWPQINELMSSVLQDLTNMRH